MQNGKGSKPRPINKWKEYQDNWDSIDWSKDFQNLFDAHPPVDFSKSKDWDKVSRHAYSHEEEYELIPPFTDDQTNSGWTDNYEDWVSNCNNVLTKWVNAVTDFFTKEECTKYFKGFALSPIILHEDASYSTSSITVANKKDLFKHLDSLESAAILYAVVKNDDLFEVKYFKI